LKTYIIYDLEATCWQDNTDKVMETIEIGAVRYSLHDNIFEPVDSFNSFIQPVYNPILSSFCTELTSITQEQVNNAEQFPSVFPEFMKWADRDETESMFCSWGEYDWKQFSRDCRLHKMDFPIKPEQIINLKTSFSDYCGTKKRFGVRRALKRMDMEFEGAHHRGIDDAKNIAKIVKAMFDDGYRFVANSYTLKGETNGTNSRTRRQVHKS